MPIYLPQDGVYLHLGAHRTGTGSFQEFLASNADNFADFGVNLAVANRDGDQRSSMKLRLPEARHFRKNDLDERRAWLSEVFEEIRINERARTLLSEENIPGGFASIFSDHPYKIALDRMKFFNSGLTRRVRRALFVIRSYDTFLPSAYRKRCEFREIDPFEIYAADQMKADRGWPELIDDIRNAFSPEELVVLTYEDRWSHIEMLQHLMPETEQVDFAPLTRRFNVSATDAACRAMQAHFASGKKLSPTGLAEIIRKYADDTSGPPIAAFSEKDAEILQSRYAQDITRIGKMSGVTLISR
jgi:hypothetical protein